MRFHWAMVVALAACNPQDKVDGLAGSLLDPDASYLDVPGRKIIDGKYSKLELDASLEGGARLLALKDVDGERQLAIINFENSTECLTGPAINFQRISSGVDVNLPPLIATLSEEGDDRVKTLRFFDFDCEEQLSAIEHSPLPQAMYPPSAPTGFLLLTDDKDGLPNNKDLYFIDPKARAVTLVKDGVTAALVNSGSLWISAGGELSALDAKFKELGRVGSVVSAFTFTGGGDSSRTVYVEEDRVFTVDSETWEPEQLADDACQLVKLEGSLAVGFFSPCAERRLTIFTGADPPKDDNGPPRLFSLGTNVVEAHRTQLAWGQDPVRALYLTNDEPGMDHGDLVAHPYAPEPGEPEIIAENAHFSRGGEVLTHWEYVPAAPPVPAFERGTLVSVYLNDDDNVEVEERLEEVVQFPGLTAKSSLGVLGHYDGVAGELATLGPAPDGAVKTHVKGVPFQIHAVDFEVDRSAFVGDLDGGTGNVYVLQDERASKVGESALPSTLRFVDGPPSIGYLAERGDAERVLTLYLFNAEELLEVAESVSDYRVLFWPSPGILYAVDAPGREALWFARAR